MVQKVATILRAFQINYYLNMRAHNVKGDEKSPSWFNLS